MLKIFEGFAFDSIEASLSRFSISFIFLLPAFYCIRESNRHRNIANRHKSLELELAALNPFISNLEVTDQQLLKQKLTPQFFGGKDEAQKENIRIYSVFGGNWAKLLEKVFPPIMK